MTDTVPSTLLYRLSDMLEGHHGEHLLAAVSTAVAPHIHPAPVQVTGPVLADVRLVVRLHLLLAEHGRTALLPDVIAVLVPYLTGQPERLAPVTPLVDAGLTGREQEILRGFADGLNYAQIGRLLGVSEHTAKTHARHTFKKLGVRDRAAAVSAAYQLGYLHVTPAAGAA